MKIVIATRNQHKLTEFQRILGPMGYQAVSQEEVCPGVEVVEDGATFAANACKKAMEIYRRTGLPTVADDSGLCVDALDGAPGVYSARYAGEQHNDQDNNEKLLHELENIPQEKRTARFVSAICCVLGEDDIIQCQGECPGQIAFQYHGDNDFGYDPLFLVGERSFAQLSGEEKDAVSHRGVALRAFAQEMNKRSRN